MPTAFKYHWPEYLIEAWALGTFMISACLFTAFLEYPGFPLKEAIPAAWARRGLIGAAMGLTAIFLIYSPWGKRSGAHMNPVVTWVFWRLGKIKTFDAVLYTVFQFLGGWLGIVVSVWLLGPVIADPSVAFAVTVPGQGGAAVAWWAEFGISFLLMGTILYTANQPALASRTGFFAGGLIALFVLFEAPLSGMSMNPARTFASSFSYFLAHRSFSEGGWIYFTAPAIGMIAATELYRQFDRRVTCAKLVHDDNRPCIFCHNKGKRHG